MIKFRYDGKAIGWQRCAQSKRGGSTHLYMPQKTRDYEEAIRFAFMANTCESMPVYPKDTALKATVTVGVEIPKSYSKKKYALCRDRVIAPTSRPDADNYAKAVMDALNGYAFYDDAQITMLVAEKVYSEKPFVEVIIDELR